jgi:hypothetical protein
MCWVQLSRLHLKGTSCVSTKDSTMVNIQNCDSCINIPSIQTYLIKTDVCLLDSTFVLVVQEKIAPDPSRVSNIVL